MIDGPNEYQQKAQKRAEEFAAILEAIITDLPGDWQLDTWDGDGFPCWRTISEVDGPRQFTAGTYLAAGKQRIEFKACGWPSYTDANGYKQTQCVSNLWNPREERPSCTCAYDRETRLVAKQIARLFPEYDRIHARLAERAADAQTYEDRTQSGLRRLAEATGNEYKPNGHRGFFLRDLPGDTVSIDFNSVGDVRVRLDTEEMLPVIALLYKLRQGDSDGSAEHEPTAAELQTVIDAGIEAIQAIVDNWESGDLAGAVNGGEDWATQAADWLPDDGKSEEGPTCGHSACSQNYIDNGERKCVQLFACPDCGCTDIQTSAWVEVNGCSVVNDEGPLDTVYCPQCEVNGDEGYKGKTRYMVETYEPKPFKEVTA